ncbi:fasciclin domain-containing protein [Leptonema illini]|jgi:uncharacterized surface protein with fasciclin (FAS1) repeats|uniref:Beta-Ig-H3/fasciclin n=1 Tax=Leptonema illini DSM 21528 TaxID=929563 RepID=H2CCI3_9LEPT|nr:fasciclin domain-containing protein [Leptonema illini]EHQ07443.1 beta-Ig-H3/fasciclin [Leptonema illini DSM 21528]
MNRQFDRIGKITGRAALLAVITTGLLGGTVACSDSSSDATAPSGGMASVQDKNSQPNVLQIAVGSKDHTTLVTAVKAAGLADSLANPGPFTVFAPTDAAFEKLPPGTVEGLLKKKAELKDILEYHVYVGGVQADYFTDGMVLNQANGKDVTIRLKDGKATVNGANIVASVKASNGVIHIIDGVLLPPSK